MTSDTSRRDFLSASTALLAGSWLATYMPAMRRAAATVHAERAAGTFRFGFFSPEEVADFEAIAAQIFPTDDTPGAREADVVSFADRAMATFLGRLGDAVHDGLVEFNVAAAGIGGAGTRFARLRDAEQRSVMRDMEAKPAFFPLQALTVMGMFADPSYGGNRDRVGWNLLGFDGVFAYQPPFGHYDRGHHEGGR